MAKCSRTFRLEEITLDRLERLAKYFAMQSALTPDLMPGQNKNVTRTDVIEFLINSMFDDLKAKGEEIPE